MVNMVGNRTLRDLLTERVERRTNHPFLVHEAPDGVCTKLTYREFLERVDRTATVLQALGLTTGNAVTVQLPNCPELLTTWFALASLGAVMVPANTANTTAELAHIIDYSESVAVITSAPFAERFQQLLRSRPSLHFLIARPSAEYLPELPERATWLESLTVEANRDSLQLPSVCPSDVAQMLFTSGTTAKPKAVALTHANCLSSGERMAKSLLLDQADRCLTALPVFHCNAQSVTVLSSLTVGATCILLEEFRASRYWEQIRFHEATQTSLVAMQVRTLLAQPEAPTDRAHQLRRVFYAINVTGTEKDRFESRFAVELINGYGLSEAMTIVTIAPVFGPKRWPSIGLPAYDRELRIVDPTGKKAPVGVVGEIIVQGVPGRTLMKGYFKDPEATAEALRDGWLYTGDAGYIDECGYIYFVDRLKDVIKRAGENVSATEVEAVLLEHPDVSEAAVVGVPDSIRDEAVKAYVALRKDAMLTESELQAYCKEQLASFKVPTIIEFRPELPKTSIGKVEKKQLRANSSGE